MIIRKNVQTSRQEQTSTYWASAVKYSVDYSLEAEQDGVNKAKDIKDTESE